jgi:aminoglycoside phosphotransferase family enzyme
LKASVLLVLKPALHLLPKGLGMGMQLASQCYAVLLKISRATEENVKPCKSQTLVELFQCMVRFDDPHFLDAVMASTVRYSDHKVNSSILCNQCKLV